MTCPRCGAMMFIYKWATLPDQWRCYVCGTYIDTDDMNYLERFKENILRRAMCKDKGK